MDWLRASKREESVEIGKIGVVAESPHIEPVRARRRLLLQRLAVSGRRDIYPLIAERDVKMTLLQHIHANDHGWKKFGQRVPVR